MNPIRNPFSPGAGSPPPELVGRDSLLQQCEVLFGRVKQKRSEKSILLTGLRGVGKTVLLNEMEKRATKNGYRTISVEVSELKTLGGLLIPPLQSLLFALNSLAGLQDKVKRALRVLRSFVTTYNPSSQEIGMRLDISAETGTADSGDLETDLTQLFVAIAEAAQDKKTAVAIFIDEIQYLSGKHFGALIMAMHKVQQRQLPLVLLGAGLPTLPALAGNAKSYAERLFSFPSIVPLTESDVEKALQEPAQQENVTFTKDALSEVFQQTKGYPYFVQEWGYQAWNNAEGSPITRTTVLSATGSIIPRLDANFFRVRFDRLAPGEKIFLRAMAEQGSDSCPTGVVATLLKVSLTSISPRRKRLIDKGMIYSPAHGILAFTVPLFGEFMIRTMPKLPEKG